MGTLSYLKIWHDNSGKGSASSWFLKYVVVHDLQTREKSFFIYEKWLAIDKDPGLIDVVIPVSGEKQRSEFIYLLKQNSKQKLTDNHLWFSVFAKPLGSTFSRLERVTCCFVLLSLSMLMNIMYYDLSGSNEAKSNGLQIGPVTITLQQVFRLI